MVSSRWLPVALLWVVALLNYLDRQVIFSLFPLLQKDLQLSSLQLGLLSTAFLWIYAAASPLGGFLADRYGRKRVVVVSLLLWSAITWATGQARSLNELLAARAFMGLSEACYLPAALALIAAHHTGATRSLATGIHQSGIYAGIVLGGVGGGWLGERFGWRFPFTVLGLIGLGYCVFLLLLKEAPGEPSERSGVSLTHTASHLLRKPAFLALLAVFAATSIANWLIYTWMPVYLYEKFGMSLAQAGFSATFYMQAGSFAGILAGGALADRWSRTNSNGRVFTQALGLVAAAPFLILAGVTGTPVVLLAGLAVFGIARGMYDCNWMPVLCQIAPSQMRSTGYGLLNMAGTFAGGTVAALAGGLKATLGIGMMLQAAGAILLLSALLLVRLRLTSSPEAAPQ